MASPVIETSSSGSVTGSTSWTCTLPTGITSGDRLLLYISGDGLTTTTWSATGWEVLAEGYYLDRATILCRTADGTESSTVAVTCSAVEAGTYACHRISGSDTDVIQVIHYQQTSATALMNAIYPAWGSDDNLFIGFAACRGNAVPNGYPTGYTSGQQTVSGGSLNTPSIAVAGKAATAASDTPDGFSLSASIASLAFTIALRPPPAAGGGGLMKLGMQGGFNG